MENNQCPNCLNNKLEPFFEVKSVPVHSVLLMDTKKEAVEYTKRDIKLVFCPVCGFITNFVFDPSVHEYSAKYEETQGFSGTFNSFHKGLAEKLIAKHGLRNKTIIEIGCGKGDFLNLMCQLGDNEGFGFDPAYIDERDSGGSDGKAKFIKDFYSEKYSHYKGDFVCCKMTLEHIPDTYRFVKMVRDSLQDNLETKVFFQIPDMEKILGELGFWDIYYEHCSYFSIPSLAYLFEKAGFEILDVGKDYDDQYLMIETKPALNVNIGKYDVPIGVEEIKSLVEYFKSN
ncbi:MAG: class I SAM-dependent methyltransferase, partial [Leptolyngbya sp. SIO1D8]|nr:class I SAM-dependent methyltransferase [Leptolyngbya sp. SIO1D8]